MRVVPVLLRRGVGQEGVDEVLERCQTLLHQVTRSPESAVCIEVHTLPLEVPCAKLHVNLAMEASDE